MEKQEKDNVDDQTDLSLAREIKEVAEGKVSVSDPNVTLNVSRFAT